MKRLYDKLSCALIGWDYNILTQCGEASHRTKNKYVSALIIVSIIWGVIGYKFASKYIGLGDSVSTYLVSFAFIVIVNCVERIIIMKQGNNAMIYIFRIVLALCMAILGSFIFDQILFSRDLETQIGRNKELEIKETVDLRMKESNQDILNAEKVRDSLMMANLSLNEQLSKNPTIERTSVSQHQTVVGHKEDGTPIYKTLNDVNRIQVENPLNNQVKANETELENNQKLLERLRDKKDNTEAAVTKEIKDREIGFMEELNASLDVFFRNWLTIFVYGILFVFMLGLELFVCSISWLEKNCDYDMIVEHQLALKELELKHSREKVKEKYVTKQMG